MTDTAMPKMRKRWELQRVGGYVWCDVHGCVHERSRDPYMMNEAECGDVGEWRELYIEQDDDPR